MTPPTFAALAGRFLRFGVTAFGGPVVQIDTLRHELVEREGWVDAARFRRALAAYQALPGPEATEMCIWFGTIARGRLGGLVAGLGFVAPGFTLMLTASVLLQGRQLPPTAVAAFAGMQAAVVALVVRAGLRLWKAAIHGRPALFAVAVASAAAALWWTGAGANATAAAAGAAHPGTGELFGCGLRAGLLTFGGAYTVIPFLQSAAVGPDGWMSLPSFLDGIALGGVMPAPMVIAGTWVGHAGNGLAGALALTTGIFLPAFAFPLLLHGSIERVVAAPRVHRALDVVTAAVVGLIAAVAVPMLATLDGPVRITIAGAAALCLMRLRTPWAVPIVMLAAAAIGALALRS